MIALPNIKKLFIPDSDYYICDCDLAQADAQVVAWEANDEELKAIFRDPTADLHTENAKAIFGSSNKRNRQLAKRGVHLTNYGGKARTCAIALGITVHEAERFQNAWFAAHPNIKRWQGEVESSLAESRSVRNKFGNHRFYFDRVDTLLPEALAWIPQSTVALVIDRGLVNLDEELSPRVEVLMQVHDSVVFQVHRTDFHAVLPAIKKCLEIVVPYDDELIIPVGLEASKESWGDCVPYNWDGTIMEKAA